MGFDELKNYAISDILSVNGKDKAARIIKNHMDNLIEVALIKGAQSRQDEIDELQKQQQNEKPKLDIDLSAWFSSFATESPEDAKSLSISLNKFARYVQSMTDKAKTCDKLKRS